LTAVSLAVASIPEGLAAIVAVVLSAGVTKMSRDNAIIRRLPAVETLGSVNVICSDKTGTLTRNQMTVVRIFTADGFLEVPAASSHLSPLVKLLASGMALCNDATLDGDQTGDPTEIALLAMADHFIDRSKLTQKRIDEKSFDSDRKMMSVLVRADNELTVFAKGALASVFKVSSKVMTHGATVPLTDEWRQKFSDAATQMSSNALRTLALAYKTVDSKSEDMESNLVLVGLVGMIDPPRDEVKPSIELAARAGIKTIMITGDHKNTALSIAQSLGIANHPDQVMTGAALDALTDDQLADEVNRYSVYARVTPEHKVRIVKALKARGNTVSMTGDGVNDAPSLNAADIGVAMGITGTDVAKGAADMILTDDNFATIVAAVHEGRTV
ncbi:MAG TPA: HAD-IC family P-type ATPase, partial [Flavobacterium sp.]|nr:HAD-IC family P-type ATPase [Flavobacterium sp.]